MENATVEKISVEENLENEEGVFFDKYEWKNFLIEITDMLTNSQRIGGFCY